MSLIECLVERLQEPLPGIDAHAKMLHVGRYSINPTIPENHKKASVMILLYQKEGEWYTVFMKRTSKYGNDKHKGQISFPGGQAEKTDENKAATAIRETEEEIGVPTTKIKVLGELTQLYIPVSNFLVYPFIGFHEGIPDFVPDADEVDELIESPLELLLNKENRKFTSMEFANGFKMKDVPYYDVYGNVVWGATSMIISELISMIEESDYLISKN